MIEIVLRTEKLIFVIKKEIGFVHFKNKKVIGSEFLKPSFNKDSRY